MITINVPIKDGDSYSFAPEIAYNINDFPYYKLDDYLSLQSDYRHPYINLVCSFDIETTSVLDVDRPYGFMYHWQMCIDDIVCFGRTWDEFIEFLHSLKFRLELNYSRKIVIYCHQLSFEFQFMRRFFEWKKVFAKDKRNVISAELGGDLSGIEFRCSYFLSNMSLEKFCENSNGCIHYKVKGLKGYPEYDYSKIRTPYTYMNEYELAYCYNDVRGLNECINGLLVDDTLNTIPLTNTGYVRRDARNNMNNPKNRAIFRELKLTPELYTMCKLAFRGGNTHASYLISGELVDEPMYSRDLSSSYPFAMMVDKFPMSKFQRIKPHRLNWALNKGLACLMKVRFEGIIWNNVSNNIPYIPIAKCIKSSNVLNDNGRVLRADSIEMVITDIDYDIIISHYNIEHIYCNCLYVAKYDYLPSELRETVMQYFIPKSKLKGNVDKVYEYLKSKNRLNALFGMLVTDIINSDIIYDSETTESDKIWTKETINVAEALEKYYNKRSSFGAYQWGVWVTANSRKRLQKAIDLLGADCYYTDTDSVKYVGNHDSDFEKLNREIQMLIEQAPIRPEFSGIDYEGNVKTWSMGYWEPDGKYERFITLGAKKYCYESLDKNKYTGDMERHTHITVSGLNKKKASKYIEQIGIDKFKEGLLFGENVSGRTTAWYNDENIHTINIDGKEFLTASSIAVGKTTYELGITGTYKMLLKNLKKGIDIDKI